MTPQARKNKKKQIFYTRDMKLAWRTASQLLQDPGYTVPRFHNYLTLCDGHLQSSSNRLNHANYPENLLSLNDFCCSPQIRVVSPSPACSDSLDPELFKSFGWGKGCLNLQLQITQTSSQLVLGALQRRSLRYTENRKPSSRGTDSGRVLKSTEAPTSEV